MASTNAYLESSLVVDAICEKVALRGTVGLATAYPAIPACTPVDMTSSAAHTPAATSAISIAYSVVRTLLLGCSLLRDDVARYCTTETT